MWSFYDTRKILVSTCNFRNSGDIKDSLMGSIIVVARHIYLCCEIPQKQGLKA